MSSRTEDGSLFPETRWSLVLDVRNGGDEDRATSALNDLCRIYWRPLYVLARSLGKSNEDAEDLTQGFMQHALRTNLMQAARSELGLMRQFLCASFKNFIFKAGRDANAQKRGGNYEIFSVEDLSSVEKEISSELSTPRSPEAHYDRQCALSLVSAALAQLERELQALGQGRHYELLRGEFDHRCDEVSASLLEISQQLNMPHGALRSMMWRWRERFRSIIYTLARDTLSDPSDDEVMIELAALYKALEG